MAGDADPQTGYTSAWTAAISDRRHQRGRALWAALIALLNESLGAPLGFAQPRLYGSAARRFHDIVTGDNGAYSAQAGWDACTGLGSPNGSALLVALSG